MTTLSTAQAVQWNHLPGIEETKPLDDNDRACLNSIRDVLERHGCLDRFGVNLLHKHFEMKPDEILIEQVDEKAHKLVTNPINIDLVRAEMPTAYETQWQWMRKPSGEVSVVCVVRCFPGDYQSPGHPMKHTS